MENTMEVIKKLKRTSYDPAIPLLGIYPKECKSGICILMFNAPLFTTV
jgi:hypothetical protein